MMSPFLQPIFATIAILICIILITIFAYYKHSFKYWKNKNVPFSTPSIPFGNCKDAILFKLGYGLMWKEFYEMFKNCGKPYCGVYMFTKPILMILDPDLSREILCKNFQHFTDRALYCDENPNDPLNGTLLSLHGPKWRRLRNKLTPTFSSAKIKIIFHIILESSKKFEEILRNILKIIMPSI